MLCRCNCCQRRAGRDYVTGTALQTPKWVSGIQTGSNHYNLLNTNREKPSTQISDLWFWKLSRFLLFFSTSPWYVQTAKCFQALFGATPGSGHLLFQTASLRCCSSKKLPLSLTEIAFLKSTNTFQTSYYLGGNNPPKPSPPSLFYSTSLMAAPASHLSPSGTLLSASCASESTNTALWFYSSSKEASLDSEPMPR